MIKKLVVICCTFISFTYFSQITMNNSIEYHLSIFGQNYKAFSYSSKDNNLYLLINDINIKEDDIRRIEYEHHSRFLVSYNKQEDSFYQENPFTDSKNKNLLNEISIDKTGQLKWVVTNEVRNILGYKCFKAIVNFRGREWSAWFTTDISEPLFPWKLKNLPGAILEAYDSNKEFHFTALKVTLNKNYVLTKNLSKFMIDEKHKNTSLYRYVFDAETKQLTEWQSMEIAQSKNTATGSTPPSPRSASLEINFDDN